ncbi:hypothetical protein VTN77DRAFT_9464 [Rasamsonia byssochlamydoides]|uniref:uncharacterized protein n=1 Tax=Rasamsonia byssochlamydoides TaxID=89139 RepID=UPI0037448BD4
MAPSKAVNHPVDPKEKDADIDNKIRLYGISKAFANGKLPSNKQCDVALNSVINSKYLASPSNKLSEEGRALVKDVRDVIEQAKVLFITKNEGDLLQEFIWEAQHIRPPDVTKLDGPVDKETAKQDTTKAGEGLKTLGTLLITNGEFRKLLSDAVVLLRDISGDISQKSAEKIKPSEEELSRIDQPAPDNEWHDKPNVSKEQLKDQVEKNAPVNLKDAQEATNAAKRAATGDKENAPVSEMDVRAGGAAAASSVKQAVSQNVPVEETKNRANDYAQKTKEYFSSKMPKERREQIAWRLKKMIVEIQRRPDYQQAIESLLTLAETYGGHTRNVSQQGTETLKCARRDPSLQIVETNLKTLIERFANCTSTDDLFESLNNLYRAADQDPQLKDWFKQMNTYIRKCLCEQGFIVQDAATQEWNRLYDQGSFLLRERYRNHVDRIGDEIKFFATQFNEDPQNRALRNSLQKLFKNLGQDENGKIKFKPHLIKDITNVILPDIFQGLRYIPLPRIEVTDRAFDAVVENIVIESDNLMPNVFEFGTDNYWRWGRKGIANKDDHRVMIAASGIQADIKDVSYYIKKKEGFPTITDTGVMDIYLGGEGFSFKISASKPTGADRQRFVKAERVSVTIRNLDIKLKKSKHKVLFNVFKPMLFNIVRPVVQTVLEKQIRDSFTKVDAFAYKVYSQVQRAQEDVKEDPRNARNVYSRYIDATRQTIMERKQKAEQVAEERKTKVQATATHHDALFKNIKLPGFVTNKATEYKELAAQGERWQSPVFDIGGASQSKDLPKLEPVTRKPHTTAESTLRQRSEEPNGHPLTYESQSQGKVEAVGDSGFTKKADQALGTMTGPGGSPAPSDVRTGA